MGRKYVKSRPRAASTCTPCHPGSPSPAVGTESEIHVDRPSVANPLDLLDLAAAVSAVRCTNPAAYVSGSCDCMPRKAEWVTYRTSPPRVLSFSKSKAVLPLPAPPTRSIGNGAVKRASWVASKDKGLSKNVPLQVPTTGTVTNRLPPLLPGGR